MWLQDYFDRVVVINLDRRPDRWKRFRRHLQEIDWPLREPERMPAVDGRATTVPTWWKQGGGAWGCLMSHGRILEDCLRTGVERVLILEDDVFFTENFSGDLETFLRHVPEDWDQLYLGGQHLCSPRPLNQHVYECVNVNRTHGHAVSREFMPRMYRYILNARDYMDNEGHHVDHRLGALQETGTVRVYAPTQWLAGQFENQSDISGRQNRTFVWNCWETITSSPLIVILGIHHSGANEVAGLLMDRFKAHFGHNLCGYDLPAAEDEGLARICEQVRPFPGLERQIKPRASCPRIHDWCRLILQEAADYGSLGAACYPTLCAMFEDFARAWPQFRVIDVRCPLQVATDRLLQRAAEERRSLSTRDAARLQRFLHRSRVKWLKHCDHLTIESSELESDREKTCGKLEHFLGVSPAGVSV